MAGAAPQVFAMGPNEIRALVEGLRQNALDVDRQRTKESVVSKFEDATSAAWRTWRTEFEMVAASNRWNNQKARRELRISMKGMAARRIQDIDVGAPVGGQPEQVADYRDLLNRYEGRFVIHQAATAIQVELDAARQAEDETPLSWHQRVQELFFRANSHRPIDDLRNEPNLIRTFIKGLANEKVKDDTYGKDPQTYEAALDACHRAVAKVRDLNPSKTVLPGTHLETIVKKEGINSLGGINSFGGDNVQSMKRPERKEGNCHYCGKPGHYKRSCRFLLNKLPPPNRDNARRNSGGRRDGGNSQKDRGSSRQRFRKNDRNNRNVPRRSLKTINSMDEKSDEDMSDRDESRETESEN